MMLFLLIGLIPAALVVSVGFKVRAVWRGDRPARRPVLFLSLVLLLGAAIAAAIPDGIGIAILLPAWVGTVAALLLFLLSPPSSRPLEEIRRRALPGLLLAALFGLAAKTDIVVLLIAALVSVAIWGLFEWRMGPRAVGLIGMAGVALIPAGLAPSVLVENAPGWFQTVYDLARPLSPFISVVLAAGIVRTVLEGSRPRMPLLVVARLAIAGVLILFVAYQGIEAMAWDAMTDGLNSVFIAESAGLAAIGVSMLMVWRLGADRAWPAAGFALAVILITQIALYVSMGGVFGSAEQMTEQRALYVDSAILQYHRNNGSYPSSLIDLSPFYVWHIPEPIMVRDLNWCYEGGADYYRLGYVYHAGFGAYATVRLKAEEGQPPALGWGCEDAAAKYNASNNLH